MSQEITKVKHKVIKKGKDLIIQLSSLKLIKNNKNDRRNI